MDPKDAFIHSVARLIEGLHVPVSLAMPLGKARDAYVDVRDVINDFGWSNANEIEEKIRKLLDTES